MSIPQLQMQSARDFGESVSKGLNQGISNFFGQLPFFNNNSANANYYKQAAQLMPGYDASSPVNVPKGIGSMTDKQVSDLIDLMGTQAKANQKINTMNTLQQRSNPNAQSFTPDMSPELAYQQYESQQGPLNKATAQQAVDKLQGGPLYSALSNTLSTNPDSIFGADHPIAQFAKANPEAWASVLKNSNSLNDLETAMSPIMEAHKLQSQESSIAGQAKEQEARIATAQAHLLMEQRKADQEGKLAPLELEEYKAKIHSMENPPANKGTLEAGIDDVNALVTKGYITPAKGRELIQQRLTQGGPVDHTQAQMQLELQKEQAHAQQQKQNQIQQLHMKAASTKDPHQRALLMDQAAQLSGTKPTLRFPYRQ